MKPTALLLGLALLSVPVTAILAQVPDHSSVITVYRVGDGCDIILPPDTAKTVTDKIWLVIDGKSEGFGGGSYNSAVFSMPLRYTASVSSDMDTQVKDILKAQGLPVKSNVTTYRMSGGINIAVGGYGVPGGVGGGMNISNYVAPTYIPSGLTTSQTLRFRHEAYALINTQPISTATYKIGDKIPIFDALALDSSITMHDVLGTNSIESGKFAHLSNDLLHRITIQVQFVPKTP
jgi:hypothetical protein